ncbi:MAG: Na/Pi cotransporter family protein [Candidatus Borkfalkiaceae bacterium]|nr:Na/Pi cotransporter family protein [Christensenellaceae bacterium]
MEISFSQQYLIVLYMLAALGAFLIGFKLLSENLQKVANKGLRKLFDKTSKSKIAGVGIGAGSTILMQSSGATTVMVIGFVNAGMMSLYQATATIMGANIGTTVTTILLAVGMANVGKYFMVFAFLGIFISMIVSNNKAKSWGLTAAGFGLVFFGLSIISACSNTLKDNEAILNLFKSSISPAFLEPFALLLIGAVITAVMQSSTAVNAILLSMVAAGIQIGSGGNAILYIVLGTNIGTCVTALISSMGASINAKRAALIHFLFNFIGSFIFLISLMLWKGFMNDFWVKIIPTAEMQLALFHLAFNSICTIIFLPLTSVFVKTTELLIKDKKKKEPMRITFMDERILSTPTVAIAQLQKETVSMGNKCMDSLEESFNAFMERDTSVGEKIHAENDDISLISKQITDYLIKVSGSNVSLHDDQRISILHHALADMLRISEISDNIVKYTASTVNKSLVFSDGVMEQVRVMFDKLKTMFRLAIAIFETYNKEGFAELEEIEESVDNMRRSLIDGHIKRLNEGACSPENSAVFINLVSNLERVGDHITFIAHTIEELS